MKSLRYLVAGTLIGLLVQFVPVSRAQAGQTCEQRPQTSEQLKRGLELADQTRQKLEKEFERKGTQAVVLARAGQDLSKYHLRYSHLGIAYRIAPVAGEIAQWRVVHKLNDCGTSVASLYRQGLGEFFMDAPFRYEASWVSLKPSLQRQLITAIEAGEPMVKVHEPQYNMLSYPWSLRYQQSNQWALELIAYAEQNTGLSASRSASQYWLRQANYVPTTLEIGPLTRLAGRTRANIAFDDHPNERRFADKIDTVTVDSVFQWLLTRGLAVEQFTVSP